jgi:hypothetical protein
VCCCGYHQYLDLASTCSDVLAVTELRLLPSVMSAVAPSSINTRDRRGVMHRMGTGEHRV